MSEILAILREDQQPTRCWIILDCGHWYEWTGIQPPPQVGEDLSCPSDKPIRVVTHEQKHES